MIASRGALLLASPQSGAEVLGTLAAGDEIDVLEIADSYSWGQRRADGVVGYVATDALHRPGIDRERLSAA